MGLKLSLVIIALFLLNACGFGLTPRQEQAIDAVQTGVGFVVNNDPTAPTGKAVCPNTGNNLKAACYAGMKFECSTGGQVTCVGDSLIVDSASKKYRVEFDCGAGNTIKLVNDVQPGDEYSCALGTMTVLGF
jgi:hypothetical protein